MTFSPKFPRAKLLRCSHVKHVCSIWKLYHWHTMDFENRWFLVCCLRIHWCYWFQKHKQCMLTVFCCCCCLIKNVFKVHLLTISKNVCSALHLFAYCDCYDDTYLFQDRDDVLWNKEYKNIHCWVSCALVWCSLVNHNQCTVSKKAQAQKLERIWTDNKNV